MRITGIVACKSSTLGSKNNVTFGRFEDDNAKEKMQKLLKDAPAQWDEDMFFRMMDEEPSIIVYTEKDGTIQGRFDDEFIKANPERSEKIGYIYEIIDMLNRLTDLHIKKKAHGLGASIREIHCELNRTEDIIKPEPSDWDKLSHSEKSRREIEETMRHLAQ